MKYSSLVVLIAVESLYLNALISAPTFWILLEGSIDYKYHLSRSDFIFS